MGRGAQRLDQFAQGDGVRCDVRRRRLAEWQGSNLHELQLGDGRNSLVGRLVAVIEIGDGAMVDMNGAVLQGGAGFRQIIERDFSAGSFFGQGVEQIAELLQIGHDHRLSPESSLSLGAIIVQCRMLAMP